MKITREDRNNALEALDRALNIALKTFYACPDEDAAMIWDVIKGIDALQEYIGKAEIVDAYTTKNSKEKI